MIHEQLAVDPEAQAVIGVGVEGIGLAEFGFDAARPARGKIAAYRWIGRAEAPAEIELRIVANEFGLAEFLVVEVFGFEPAGGGFFGF